MSYSAWAFLMAIVLAAPPTVVFIFSNVFAQGDLFIFHGGSLVNEAPAPVAGAGLAFLALSAGVVAVAKRFSRKQKQVS